MAVVYGAIGNVSIAGLFLGGVLPGLMIGVGTAVGFRFHNGFVPAVAAMK